MDDETLPSCRTLSDGKLLASLWTQWTLNCCIFLPVVVSTQDSTTRTTPDTNPGNHPTTHAKPFFVFRIFFVDFGFSELFILDLE